MYAYKCMCKRAGKADLGKEQAESRGSLSHGRRNGNMKRKHYR
jgi:hypothetical protein